MSLRGSGALTSNSQGGTFSNKDNSQNTYLKLTLKEAGIILCISDDLNILTQEQALVVRDLEKIFAESTDNNYTEFVCELKTFCTKEKYFKKALLNTNLKKSNSETIPAIIQIQQESLFRLLLRVNRLQKDVVEILLDEITTTASEENQDTSWLRLLLNPLRYLPYIRDGDNLTTKLLDILEVASFASQLEILDSIPEILPDSQYSEAAKQLSRLLDDNDELSGAIIDCLNALNLNSDMRMHVQDRILAKILGGTSLKIFPVLLEFLMTDCKSQNLVQTLLKIRNALDTIMTSTEKSKERESSKILIFNRLQTFAISPKTVCEAWLNMISIIKVHSDHKPIDYLILFMLHSTVKLKKKIIEGIFRKRIQSGLFKIALVEKLFEKCIPHQLLKDYFGSIVEIGCNLLRTSQDISILEFVTTLFRILFNHEHTEVIYRQELLESLIVLTGASSQKTASVVLKIFHHLLQDSSNLQRHTVLLMRLLEKLDTFELKDVKQVFELLCALTCGDKADESLSGLKDELHMIVRKQLSSSKRIVKHRGIISAVVMVKYIASTSAEQSDVSITNESIISIANLPQGLASEAACLLELTCTNTSSCPELMGLYYDQLASMLMTTDFLDKYFMAWLYESITNDFQTNFVTEIVCEPVNDLEFSLQYLLNNSDETDTPIGVNIAELTVKSTNSNSIMLMAPHFRLLRLLHFRQHNGDLSTIDALLGCGIILPATDNIDDLDSDQVKLVANCLFHCINWFREIINGFLTQKNKKLRARVVQRLNELIQVEKLLNKCMEYIPEHKLPVSYFDNLSQASKQNSVTPPGKPKNPRKKLKPNETDEAASASTSNVRQRTKSNVAKKNEYHIHFREVDTDLVILLKYPLKFDEDEEMTQSTQSCTLNIDQLNFILNDFVSKLTMLTQEKNMGLSHLNTVVPINLITDCIIILPNIDRHLRTIVNKINALLEATDGRHDLPEMFTERALEIKTTFSLILESFCLIFSWSGFQHSRNLELLKNIIKSLRPEQSQTLNSANRLIIEFINRLSNYCNHCLHLSQAVHLVKTMESLYSTTVPSSDIKKKIVATTSKLLSKRWYNDKGNLDCGKTCNHSIQVLVNVYLNGASIKTICGIVATLQEQIQLLKTKEDCLHMLAAIDKQNFYVFYLGLCSALQNRVKIEIQTLTNNEHLVLWRTTALTMQGLMTIAKAHETKTNLACFLKKSIGILKVFLSQGIPILEIMLRSKPDEVVAIFKTMQTNTRFLHHLCCYSKLTKDASLMAYVPQFRLTLETLVYRVKAALVANNCSAAFWMGNLRNRDLQGEDIISQSTVITENGDDGNDDDQLPDDESDSDILNETHSGDRSDSEVYE